jgi:NodT family efflux transporter outer membrane factor (OMF) lipoprotein
MRNIRLLTITLGVTILCASCGSVGPDYSRPVLSEIPAGWKMETSWQPTIPADAIPKKEWWKIFGDKQLDELENNCLKGNPNLKAAVARLDQALAQSNARGAGATPTVALNAGVSRSLISANRPQGSYNVSNSSTVQNDFKPNVTVSYEVDWLGRVRRDIESARASAQQATADRENVRLVLTAQVASAYFQLRQFDEEISFLSKSITLQEKVLELIRIRRENGAAAERDVLLQSALAESSSAQLELLKNQRKQTEDLLATLTGVPAASFILSSGILPVTPPSVPAGVPATLLERRPDIAAAERAMAAANAQIGVAKAAYFPTLSLTPVLAGFESNNLSNLFSTPSLVWSIGVQASQTLFDGGRNRAGVVFAKAGYAGTLANYRQTVLVAIQEAQDALSTSHGLSVAKQKQDAAVRDQNRVYEITLLRYKEGLDNALTLATIQQNQISALRLQSQIRGGQFLSAVNLLKALGGGWQESELKEKIKSIN